jgi:hypothetical protein
MINEYLWSDVCTLVFIFGGIFFSIESTIECDLFMSPLEGDHHRYHAGVYTSAVQALPRLPVRI